MILGHKNPLIIFIYLFICFSDFPLMGNLLGSLRTWNPLVWHTQRTSQWEYTRAFGTLTIGPREVGLSRLIGPKAHSLPPLGTLKPMAVFGPMEFLHVILLNIIIGFLKNLISAAKGDSIGFRRSTWFIIIALIPNDFLRALLQNALWPLIDYNFLFKEGYYYYYCYFIFLFWL